MSKRSLTPVPSRRPRGAALSVPLTRGVTALMALALTAGLGACAGGMPQANPVCLKPSSKAMQLAPAYQCGDGMTGRVMVNR